MASNGDLALRGSTRQRLPRSRNGCMTCRRRKVRCNEQRPRCSHCERLDLQCAWKASQPGRTLPDRLQSRQQHDQQQGLPSDSIEDHLDFNDIIWQGALQFDSAGFDWPNPVDPDMQQGQSWSPGTGVPNVASDATPAAGLGEMSLQITNIDRSQLSDVSHPSPESLKSTSVALDVDRNALVEHFLASVVPPLLAVVETGPRWTSTKLLLVSLAAASDMVQDAIAAFSALQLSDDKQEHDATFQLYYDRCKQQVLHHVVPHTGQLHTMAGGLSSVLATIFFLSYSALLSDRVEDAHVLLQHGAQVVGMTENENVTTTVKRLISWIRLVDGRASSTGGSGLFLRTTDRQASTHEIPDKATAQVMASTPDDIEEILFDMLYTPGLVFYQQVQSIMARVSAIDKWHRSRGTVRDETEVMAAAAIIFNDLLSIETQRPALMDSAVAGSLTDKYLMADLSTAVVRSYRTYWANYHAGHIHLHRVAYTHLEASIEVKRARSTIKHIARLLEKSHDQLPANLIWPLLMAGCEEDDPDEREWIISGIRGMQSSATNARPIAHVLEEVHRRQDTTKRRADIRQTSIDMFNRSFAVF